MLENYGYRQRAVKNCKFFEIFFKIIKYKKVAIFIVQKILLDDAGLNYICQTYERFFAVTTVLSSMTMQLVEQKSLRLIKHVIRCYLRLADNKKALEGLRQILPEPFRTGFFNDLIKDDPSTVKFYSDLMNLIEVT